MRLDRVRGLAGAVGLLGLLSGAGLAAEPPADRASFHITPVEGPSWRSHLNLPFDQSAMGRMGVTSGPLPSRAVNPWGHSALPESLDRPFVLTGADLYRLNCQSCHNVGGSGSPPEIRSLIDPVRATSFEVTKEQLQRRGAELSESAIREMAAQARASLLDRFQNGGERMPSFRHLDSTEVDVLLSYLRGLAALPESPGAPKTVSEPFLRVGEHVVKGTCYICHDSTGPGSDAMATTPQLIPSLASFPEQKSVAAFVRKVKEGAPAPGTLGKTGRMPVFSYLTDEEVTAAYLYLVAYPPRPGGAPGTTSPHP
jgi:mono/diheme cytochrome c family protein